MKAKILIVDDEHLLRWSLKEELSKAGFDTMEADSVKSAKRAMEKDPPDVMLLDQNLPDGTGLEILEKLRALINPPAVIMLTVEDKSDTAVKAMKLGASDYVTKPVDINRLLAAIQLALDDRNLAQSTALALDENGAFCGMLGKSPGMKRVYSKIERIAGSDATTVLVTGESGTGKELAVRAIHGMSKRADRPLMIVNCSALTETLIASELFGHEKGAFTDARMMKKGIFETADQSTVFLDEIGDLPVDLQAKLLRVLEQKTFKRVGGADDLHVDVRVVAATNQPLESKVQAGAFRVDLFYRLSVVNIDLPPLRDRGEDILLLANHFLAEYGRRMKRSFRSIDLEVEKELLDYPWPGNVRELKNLIEQATILYDDDTLRKEHLHFMQGITASPSAGQPDQNNEGELAEVEPRSLNDLERQAIVDALEHSRHNQTQAARNLGISRDTLRYRMQKYGIR